jgi:ubiquinone/menaquinone biosynthesis C-methylase UbiE
LGNRSLTFTTPNFDSIQYKNNTRLNWNTVAPKYHEDWASTYTGPFKSTIELVKLAEINQNDMVLDLACGTGAVANEVIKLVYNNHKSNHINNGVALVGVDISRVALSIAKSSIYYRFPKSFFIEMDSENLGFRNASFNKILCQFGLMFFPNTTHVLIQLNDLLIKGGKLIISVHGTSEGVPYFSCIMDSILKYIPDIRPKGTPSVHNFGNPDDLYNALESASFHDISIRKYTFLYKAGTYDEYWSDYMSSTANSIRSIIESKGTDILSSIKEDSKVSANRFADNTGILSFPWDVLIATAHNN